MRASGDRGPPARRRRPRVARAHSLPVPGVRAPAWDRGGRAGRAAARGRPPNMRLEGRSALVTGAGRGLGRALALGLAREGADVAVHYNRSAAGAEQVADEIRGLGRRAVTVQADITSLEDVERMVAGAYERFGRIEVLVNNVGDAAPEQQSWRSLDEGLIDRVLLTDVKGTLLVTHAVGRRMLEHGAGAIVSVCSNVVVTGSPRAPQYAASKYGVIGLTKSYAAAFAPTVRVNALGPGFIETETTLA